MRHLLVLAVVLFAAPAFGQAQRDPGADPDSIRAQHLYGLDPYNPTDAQFLRDWGGALMAQTPLLELSKLDAFVPSQAALRRRIGEGLPLWVSPWYWSVPATFIETREFQAVADVRMPEPQGEPLSGAPLVGAAPEPGVTSTRLETLLRPENNDGVWVRYAGEKWLHDGAAVPLDLAQFTRAGDYAGFPVFTRNGPSDGLIYLPTREGLVAPYRRKE